MAVVWNLYPIGGKQLDAAFAMGMIIIMSIDPFAIPLPRGYQKRGDNIILKFAVSNDTDNVQVSISCSGEQSQTGQTEWYITGAILNWPDADISGLQLNGERLQLMCDQLGRDPGAEIRYTPENPRDGLP